MQQRQSRRAGTDIHAELLRGIYEARKPPHQLAQDLGLSLEELAAHVQRGPLMPALRALRLLADVQSQIALSRSRLGAAEKLREIAEEKKGGSELARRACADLLRIDLIPLGRADDGGDGDEDDPPLDEHRLHAALESLGRVVARAGADEDHSDTADPPDASGAAQ